MSNTLLINWFEQLLFGDCKKILPVPKPLAFLAARLMANGVSWQEVSSQGGLTRLPEQIQQDLDTCLDHLDKDKEPTFQTNLIHNFFNRLVTLLARQIPPIHVTGNDELTLQAILSGSPGPFQYDSASFWGELARQWLNLHRPLPEKLMPLPTLTTHDVRRTCCLYDTTCHARGERLDPLSSFMVPSSEYVNPIHWKTETLLEHFIQDQPNHILSQTIKRLVSRAIHQLLEGKFPTCLDAHDVDSFLQNLSAVDLIIPKVETTSSPPLVIDVFHRLLALVHLDHLWETCSTVVPADIPNTTDVMHLTHQLILAERQNQLLLQQISLD